MRKVCCKPIENNIVVVCVGSWVINNKFHMGFDDEQKLLMMSKTFELKINTLESLELRNKAVKATHVR